MGSFLLTGGCLLFITQLNGDYFTMSDITDDKDLQKLIPQKAGIIIGIDNPIEYKINPKISFKKQTQDVPELLEKIVSIFFKYRTELAKIENKEQEIIAQISEESLEGKENIDQKKIDKLQKHLSEIREEKTSNQNKLAQIMFNSISDNIFKILGLITGIEKKIFEDISNDQLVCIVDLIFKENYEIPAGNVIALVNRAKKTFTSRK